MEKRWNVYHGSESLGLMTAKEIREALRHGTLDPFDKVALEGSNIREDLIEVDEIFREASSEAASFTHDPDGTQIAIPSGVPGPLGSISLAATQKPALAQMLAMKQPPLQAQAQPPIPAANLNAIPMTSPSPSVPLPLSGQLTENLHDTPHDHHEHLVYRQQESEGLKAPQKRYYVLDREKVLGPLSAVDIQALFNRGVLGKKVRVQKMGSSRAVPIAQFIESYAGDRLKELAEDGKIPKQIGVGSPSSKVLNELARMADSRRVAKDQQNRFYALLAVAAVLIAIIFVLLFDRSRHSNPPAPSRSRASESSEADTKREDSLPPSRSSRPRLVQKVPERSSESPSPASEAPDTSRSPEPRRIETTPRPPARVPVAAEKASAPTKVSRPKSSPSPAPREIAPKKQEAPRVAAPASRPAAASRGVIAKASEAAGRIQTVGPLSFSPAALDACPSKCNLTLRDATGASMKAVFFKSAYYDQLKPRSRSVTLTGNTKLEAGELVLIIQDLR